MNGVSKCFTSTLLCTKNVYTLSFLPTDHQLSRRRKKVILDLVPALLTPNNSNKRSLANTQTNNCKITLFHQLCKVDEQLLYRATGGFAPGGKGAGGVHVVPYYIDFVVGCARFIGDWSLSGQLAF